MTDRPIRVVRPKRYHLRGHHNHFPRANLTGASDKTYTKIPFEDDQRTKLAWAKTYSVMHHKLAALYGDERPDQYWLDEAKKQLGPEADKDSLRLMAARLAQGQGQGEVAQAQLDRFKGLDQRFANEGQLGDSAPRPHLPAVENQTDASGQDQPVFNDTIFNSAANRALEQKGDYLGTAAEPSSHGTSGNGLPGFVEPVANLAGPRIGTYLPEAIGLGMGFADARKGQVDRKGHLTGKPGIYGDAAKQVQANGTDQVAGLNADYNAAVQNGDDAKASELAAKIQNFKNVDAAEQAHTNVSNDHAGAAQAGSQVGNVMASQLWKTPGMLPGLSRLPLPVAGAVAGLPIGAAVGAWSAPKGEKLHGALEGGKAMLEPTARGIADVAGIRAALPATATLPPGASLGARAANQAKSLISGPETGRLGAVKNLARNGGRAGAIVGGVRGISDLAHWAGLTPGSDEWQAAQDAASRTQVQANDVEGKGEKTLDAVGAGLQAGLTGNLDPARRQVGAAWGRMGWAKGLPMGRQYDEAKRDLAGSRAYSEGKQQAMEALKNDPRFQGIDPGLAEHLSHMAGEQAHAASQTSYQSPTSTGMDDTRAGNESMTAYAQALDAHNQGKATPEQLQELGRLAGSPVAGQMTAEQQSLAGRNATLEHRFGKSMTGQMLQGNAPYKDEAGQLQFAQGLISNATGQTPADAWAANRKPAQPAPAAPAPQPAPKPAAPVPAPTAVKPVLPAPTAKATPAPLPTPRLPATPTIKPV